MRRPKGQGRDDVGHTGVEGGVDVRRGEHLAAGVDELGEELLAVGEVPGELRNSSKSSGLQRGHWVAGTVTVFQPGRVVASQKNPRRPKGVDMSRTRPPLTAVIGRSAENRSSETWAASSTRSRPAPE